MNHVDVYYKQAREMIQMNDLMNVFDEVHRMIGARKVFCKHIAKCAVIWISDDNVIVMVCKGTIFVFGTMWQEIV